MEAGSWPGERHVYGRGDALYRREYFQFMRESVFDIAAVSDGRGNVGSISYKTPSANVCVHPPAILCLRPKNIDEVA